MGRLLLIALAVLLLAAPAASAQSVVDDAAAALATDPVYVAPDADRALSSREADELRQRIQDSGAGPMYVAVLPQSALDEGGGSAEGVARELARRLQREGVYAVVAGTKFSAGGTNIRGAGDQATEALQAHKDEGVAAVLLDFTDRVGQLRAGESPGSGARDGGGGGGGAFSLLLLPLIAIGGGALLLSRRRRRRWPSSRRTSATIWWRWATTSARSTSTSRCPTPTRRRRPTTGAPSRRTIAPTTCWTAPARPRTSSRSGPRSRRVATP